MIVVMPDAHALPPGTSGFEEYGPANSDALCRELAQDPIPLVEQNYTVDARPEARPLRDRRWRTPRADRGLNHHDQFRWIGAFSSAPPPTNSVASGLGKPVFSEWRFEALLIACGKNDFLQRNGQFDALLKEKGIRMIMETAGDHSWPVWRNYLVSSRRNCSAEKVPRAGVVSDFLRLAPAW